MAYADAAFYELGQMFNYGFTLGTNIADLTIKQVASTQRKVGINAGIKLQLKLTQLLSLHASAVVSQKGSSAPVLLNTSQGALAVKDKLALTYIDFPLLISRSVIALKNVRLYPMIGIEPGILASAFNEVPRMENNQLHMQRTNLLKDTQPEYINTRIVLYKNSFGLTAGISGQYKLARELILFLDLRYARSLSPVIETATGGKIRNAVLSINTGLLF